MLDIINEVHNRNDIVIVTPFKMVEAYLEKVHPLIEVGRNVQTIIYGV